MLARPIYRGRTYLVTRRCSERRFFLAPKGPINDIVGFALGLAKGKHGMQVHAFKAMSNHIHLVITDVDGVLPDFMRDLDREISKAASSVIGRWDGFWEPNRSYSAVRLLDERSIIEKIAYVEGNAVTAGLVKRAKRWPGQTSAKLRFHQRITIARPDCRYYANSSKPESVVLEVVPPLDMDPIELRRKLDLMLHELEQNKVTEMRRTGRKFVGELTIINQDPYDSPTSWEKRRGRNPKFAGGDRWLRAEQAQRNREWQQDYRAAYLRFAAGERGVKFPPGTWKMVRLYGCQCMDESVIAMPN